MTLERILKAAVNSMVRGHHTPHCYHAWVKDEGYVNNGSGTVARHDRADYLRQLEHAAQAEVDNMGWADGYAGTGYTQPKHGVLMANWNCLPRGLDTILERAGYGVEWSDEWTTCEDCNKALRTSPDSHDWRPSYADTSDGAIVCEACAQPEDE